MNLIPHAISLGLYNKLIWSNKVFVETMNLSSCVTWPLQMHSQFSWATNMINVVSAQNV